MSGLLGPVQSAVDVFGKASQAVGSSNASAIDTSGESWTSGTWSQQLQPGSWRGVGFVLDAGETHAGRRVAIHEYPYRDDAWAEDLGKLPRRFSITAFLTGDTVYQQRDAMLAACEKSGVGTLVHPTLGSIQCVLLEFAFADRRERGRYVEIQFSFILSGDVTYPSTSIATGAAVLNAASALNIASMQDLGSALGSIGAIPAAATQAVSQFTGMATAAVNDASRVIGAVRGLQGFFGRFATGSRQTMLPADATVSSVLAAATTARTAVYSAADLVKQTAALL